MRRRIDDWAAARTGGAVVALLAALLLTPTHWIKHHPSQWLGIVLGALLLGAALGALIGPPYPDQGGN